MQDRIFNIEIPVERVTEIKEGGKRETKDAKIFPGYVLVRMEMDDDAWTCVRNTPGVTGFLGANGKPAPLSRDEYNKMMRKSAKGGTPKRTSVSIEVGTPVKVVLWSSCRFRRQGVRGQTLRPPRSRSRCSSLAARPRSSFRSTRSRSSSKVVVSRVHASPFGCSPIWHASNGFALRIVGLSTRLCLGRNDHG